MNLNNIFVAVLSEIQIIKVAKSFIVGFIPTSKPFNNPKPSTLNISQN